jgi:hypothetical protein
MNTHRDKGTEMPDLLQQAADAATEGRIDQARELLRRYLEARDAQNPATKKG